MDKKPCRNFSFLLVIDTFVRGGILLLGGRGDSSLFHELSTREKSFQANSSGFANPLIQFLQPFAKSTILHAQLIVPPPVLRSETPSNLHTDTSFSLEIQNKINFDSIKFGQSYFDVPFPPCNSKPQIKKCLDGGISGHFGLEPSGKLSGWHNQQKNIRGGRMIMTC